MRDNKGHTKKQRVGSLVIDIPKKMDCVLGESLPLMQGPLQVYDNEENPFSLVAYSRPMRPTFPVKLHDMLEEADDASWLSNIVSWQPHGRSFIVHEPCMFVEECAKRSFFKQTKFPSFQRQLNLYGFRRISAGVDKGAYYHELFLRGERGLSYRIKRIRIKGTKVRKAGSPEDDPNFYTMPFMPPSGCCPKHRQHDIGRQVLMPMPVVASNVLSRRAESYSPIDKETASRSLGTETAFIWDGPVNDLSLTKGELPPPENLQGDLKYVLKSASDVSERMITGSKIAIPIACRDKQLLLPQPIEQGHISYFSIADVASGAAVVEKRYSTPPPRKSDPSLTIIKPCRIARNVSFSPDAKEHHDRRSEGPWLTALTDSPYVLRLRHSKGENVEMNKYGDDDLLEPLQCNTNIPHHVTKTVKSNDSPASLHGFGSLELLSFPCNNNLWNIWEEDVELKDVNLTESRSNLSCRSQTGQDDPLSVEELPADTELEEFVAFYMSSIDRN